MTAWVDDGSSLGTLTMGFELCFSEAGAGAAAAAWEGRRRIGWPLREETIWEAKVWVPGPGAWVEVGARGSPGWATAGRGRDIGSVE